MAIMIEWLCEKCRAKYEAAKDGEFAEMCRLCWENVHSRRPVELSWSAQDQYLTGKQGAD